MAVAETTQNIHKGFVFLFTLSLHMVQSVFIFVRVLEFIFLLFHKNKKNWWRLDFHHLDLCIYFKLFCLQGADLGFVVRFIPSPFTPSVPSSPPTVLPHHPIVTVLPHHPTITVLPPPPHNHSAASTTPQSQCCPCPWVLCFSLFCSTSPLPPQHPPPTGAVWNLMNKLNYQAK